MMRKVASKVRHAIKRIFAVAQPSHDISNQLAIVPLFNLIPSKPSVQLQLLGYQDGNVRPVELLTIGSIISESKPLRILEVGTFNGNTTLQMALNAPENAKVYTLDLPYGSHAGVLSINAKDLNYIRSRDRPHRAYVETDAGSKICELFGDSAKVNFSEMTGPLPVDLAFIDGSHSYDYVKNDTEKVFSIMAPGGIVLWHDYDFRWPGVCKYLNELNSSLAIWKIEDTTIAYHKRPG
jgi:hypothetical protein